MHLQASAFVLIESCTLGEQGKVDESMREMAAIEALKGEKNEKEVRFYLDFFSS